MDVGLRPTKVGASTPCLSCAPNCCLQSLRVIAGQICSRPRLFRRPVEGGADIASGIIRDVAEATELGAQLVELSVILGRLAAKRSEKVEQMLRLDAACARQF